MPTRRANPWLCTLAGGLTFACGPSPDSTSTGASEGSSDGVTHTGTTGTTGGSSGAVPTTGSTTTTEGAAPEPCMCITPRPIDFPTCDEATPFACDLPPICGHVGYSCPRPNQDFYACAAEYEYDEVALACALTALRDRTPGMFTAGGENTTCGLEGCGLTTHRIAIAAGDRAMMQSCSASPIGLESSSAAVASLAPPAFFQDCLDLPAASSRYNCLFSGLQRPVPVCE